MRSNGYCKNGAPMCFQHVLLLNDFLRRTWHLLLDFIVLPNHKNVTDEICMPYATSKIVPNSMPITPLPGAIAERFQVSVTYIFASHKWKFENRKRCLNCQYSPTENTMLAFRSANTVFHRGVHKPEFWSSLSIWDNDIAVFDTGTHLRQPWLSKHG